MAVIDLNEERAKRGETDIDPKFITTDQFGVKMFIFHASYKMGEGLFDVRFYAYDFEDAAKRIEAMRAGLILQGQLVWESD